MFIKILSKKITKSILFVFFVFFVVVIKINAENLPVRVDPEDNPTNFVNKTTYTLLAPFGDSLTTIDTTNVADYFNLMIKIFIGLCAVLAVVMIVVFGIQYMGTDSIFSKSKAKKRIGEAILGLLIALGSYAFLNTINPDLTEIRLNIGKVGLVIDLPDVGDGTIDPNFKTKNAKYYTDASISPAVVSIVEKLKQGYTISKLDISSNSNSMVIQLKKGSEVFNSNSISITPGTNGYSEVGQGVQQDHKTPKGVWRILEIRTSPNGKPVYSQTGSNMGASFWLLNPTINGERGIGIHGNERGTLGATNGCIRMKNADILALLPYIKPGISVNIR